MPNAPVERQFEKDVVEILSDLTADWDQGLSGPLGPNTSVVGDLGFESLDVVYLVTAIEDRYGRQDLPFEELLMTDGRLVDDLTVNQIADFLSKHIG
ncbi:MAG TPA: acyl carrier protein [Pirellulales bacterium]|jgi:acyl carrier protein|nr:acyl carrier protein [Pirellulales bacterium]